MLRGLEAKRNHGILLGRTSIRLARRIASWASIRSIDRIPMGGVVLVVDDDALTRDTLAGLLAELGYEVATTATSEEALQFIYSEDACDAVLADVVLPGMWEDEPARRIREARPGMKLILLSGSQEGIAPASDGEALALRTGMYEGKRVTGGRTRGRSRTL